MSGEYVRRTLGVSFKRGDRVSVDGRPGVIVSFPGGKVGVRFDDVNHTVRCDAQRVQAATETSTEATPTGRDATIDAMTAAIVALGGDRLVGGAYSRFRTAAADTGLLLGRHKRDDVGGKFWSLVHERDPLCADADVTRAALQDALPVNATLEVSTGDTTPAQRRKGETDRIAQSVVDRAERNETSVFDAFERHLADTDVDPASSFWLCLEFRRVMLTVSLDNPWAPLGRRVETAMRALRGHVELVPAAVVPTTGTVGISYLVGPLTEAVTAAIVGDPLNVAGEIARTAGAAGIDLAGQDPHVWGQTVASGLADAVAADPHTSTEQLLQQVLEKAVPTGRDGRVTIANPALESVRQLLT